MAIFSSSTVNGNGVKHESSVQQSRGGFFDFFRRGQDTSSGEQTTVIRDTVNANRSKITTDVADVDMLMMDNMTAEAYIDYISDIRLTTLPHRGSTWDKVLRWAEFFGVQITSYAAVTDSFAPGSEEAAKQILTLCRSLLMLGPTNASALETTFSVFHDLALSLAFLLRHKTKLGLTQRIRNDVSEAYNDLLNLVFSVTSKYKSRVSSLPSGSSVGLDFYATFGRLVDTFENRKNDIVDGIWMHQLGRDSLDDIQVIRKWLGPKDPCIAKLLTSDASRPSSHFQFTCEWFERHLLDFSRSDENMLAVTGAPGTGKGVLASWTRERLQRSLGRTSFDTMFYTIDANIPSEATTTAVVRGLLLQLLELSVGNTALFNALESAYKVAATTSAKGLEDSLWKALEHGLGGASPRSERLMIVLDGLNSDNEQRNEFLADRIAKLSHKHESLQAVLFATKQPRAASQEHWKVLEVKPDHTYEDVKQVIDSTLARFDQFKQMNHQARVNLADGILQDAKGNFLWARLLIELMSREKSPDAFQQVAKTYPKTLPELLTKMIGTVDLNKPEVKLIVSWLLAAERPLTITEIKTLMQVDLGKKVVGEWNVNISDFLNQALGPLVFIKKDFVVIRHDAVRTVLLDVQKEGKRVLPHNEAHADVLKRTLTYAKVCFPAKQEPTFDKLPKLDLKNHFQSYPLLEYTIRYWISHFRQIPSFKNDTTFDVPEDIKSLFPSSPRFAVVEWTLWDEYSTTTNIVPVYDLSLRIRQKVFTDKSESVLQLLIILGIVHQKVHQRDPAADYFYRASIVGQHVLPTGSTITLNCSTTFLTLVESMTSTSRTEIITRKETIIKYVITSYKQQYGESSELVIRYQKLLAQIYVEIHEEEKAVEIYRELRIIIVKRYGEGSDEDQEINRRLNVVLKSRKVSEEIDEYDHDIFAVEEISREGWTVERIRVMLEMAYSYMKREDWFLAEETFVTLWSQLLYICRHKQRHDVQMHIMVINVANEYVKFLKKRSRHEEACSILIVIAKEYEHEAFDSVEFMMLLKSVGEQLKTFQMLEIAESVFKKVSNWFKATGRYDHAEVKSLETLIVQTSEEITTVATKETQITSSSSSEETETHVRRLFMQSMSKTVSSESIAASRAMFATYTKEERWSEAIESIEKSLSVQWTEIATIGGTVTLPSKFVDESIEFALLLASCHIRLYQYHEAEDIYVKVYRACKSSLTIEDQRFSKVISILLAYYEERKYYHEIIQIQKELLVEYRRYLGPTHKLTIATLYSLARLTTVHGNGTPEEYYREIVTVLTKNGVVSVEAMEATTALFEIYYSKRSWMELEVVCKSLWQTWMQQSTERKFEATFVELLYSRYTYTLKYHSKADWAVIRKVTAEYREVSKKAFGESSQIATRASVSLSNVLMERKETMQEAMSICEEIITTSSKSSSASSSVSQSTMAAMKRKVAQSYLAIASSESSSTSSTSVERALTVVRERYSSVTSKYGYAHSESLKTLDEMVMLQKKLKTTESHSTMVKIVRAHILDIVTKEKLAKNFSQGAVAIASILVKSEMVEFGRELLAELRRQIVIKSYVHSEKHGFKVEVTDKTCYVFLARLEAELLHVDFASVMADLLTETFLYEHYQRSTKGSVEITELLVRSARLRSFWAERQRVEEYKHLEQTSFEVFWKTWASGVKARQEGARTFYVILLDHLGGDVTTKVDLGTAACIAGTDKVHSFLIAGNYQSAYEVAYCTFHFTNTHKGYQQKQNMSLGFKLAGYLVGRGTPKSIPENAQFRAEMRTLSNSIMAEVLATCRKHNISFTRLQLPELNELIALLGAQGNWSELERILADLWENREGRKHWPEGAFLQLGRRYIEACAMANHMDRAIHLCEDIRYNLQRVGGVLDTKTLSVTVLLSELYSKAGRYVDAMQVHEEVLRFAVNGDDYNDRTEDYISPETAREHLEMLRTAFVRNGGWEKSSGMYQRLVRDLLAMPEFKGKLGNVAPADKWNPKDKVDADVGLFLAPKDWEFVQLPKVTKVVLKA